MGIRKVGATSILAYFSLFYFLPLILMVPLGPHPVFNYSGDVLISGTIVLLVLTLSFLFARTGVRLPTSWAARLPNIFEYKAVLFVFVLISLPISIRFYSEFGAGFRYSGIGLSNAGFVAQYMFLYKSFYYPFTLYCFFCFLGGHGLSRSTRSILFVGSIVWAFSANGSVDIIWLVVALSLAIFGDAARHYFVTGARSKESFFRLFGRNVVLVLLLFGTAFGIVFFGFANKSGVEAAIARFNVDNILGVGYYLYYRFSVFLAPIERTLSYGIDWEFYARSIDVLGEMISYRIKAIVGIDVLKPELGGINQLNYFEIYNYPTNMRSGSSPGVIASFLYLPIVPVNLVLSSLYIAAVMNSYDRAAPLKHYERPTVFTMFFMIFASFTLLHSPLEAFLKVGPELLTAVMVLYAFAKARNVKLRADGYYGTPGRADVSRKILRSS